MKFYTDADGTLYVTDKGKWYTVLNDNTVGPEITQPTGKLTAYNMATAQPEGSTISIPEGQASQGGVMAIANEGFVPANSAISVNIEAPKPQLMGQALQPKLDPTAAKNKLKEWYFTKDPMYDKIAKLTGTKDYNKNAATFSEAIGFSQATGLPVLDVLGNEQFKSQLTGTGTPTTSIYRVVTDPAKATTFFTNLVKDYLGQDMLAKLDPKDTKQFINELNALEKKSGQKTVYSTKGGVTTQQQVSAGVTDADREQLAINIIKKYVPGAQAIANIGGLLGSNYNTLKTLTSAYGVTLPDADIRQLAINSLTSKTAIDDAKTKVQSLAKATYRNLAPFIDQGLTVKDIASQYINRMSNVLEISPDGIDLNDRYIQEVLSADKLPSLNEFTIKLRNTPMWQKTSGAIEEAASYAKKILSDFGLI
jgi:hypothetical protein